MRIRVRASVQLHYLDGAGGGPRASAAGALAKPTLGKSVVSPVRLPRHSVFSR